MPFLNKRADCEACSVPGRYGLEHTRSAGCKLYKPQPKPEPVPTPLWQVAADAMRSGGLIPEEQILKMLPDSELRELIAYHGVAL